MTPLADGILEMVRPLADAKGLRLTFVSDASIGSIRSDPRVVEQILTNLLGNAVKFTDSGGVRLTISAEDGRVALAVADTGRGISAREVPHIMERFYQAEPVAVAKNEGAGLGLAISSRLAEMIGAAIDVSSEIGVGSTFTLRVPGLPDPAIV